MKCPNPIFATSLGVNPDTGKLRISFKGSSLPSLALPCGKCPVCLANKQSQWRLRMALELFQREKGSFLTLTYNDDFCDGALHKDHVQKFLKRLRNVGRDFGIDLPSFTYYACGEFGKTTHRPHYHLALFGLNLLEFDYSPTIFGFDNGFPLFQSAVISKVWPFGFNTVGELNEATIGYVSKYITKPSKSEWSLKSHGLGVAPFVSISRKGRQVSYVPKSLLFDSYERGFIVLPDSSGFSKRGLPKNLLRYLERIDRPFYDSVRERSRDWYRNHPISSGELHSALAIGERIKAENYQKMKGITSL